jgi:hypothetical protein
MNLMSSLVKRWIPTLIATTTGLVVLFGYLVENRALAYFRDSLIEWAVIVAAFAFILGIFNIWHVHGERVLQRRQGWFYSLVLLFTMSIAWIFPLLPSNTTVLGTLDLDRATFDSVISPLGASLGALVVFTLALAAFRLLRARPSAGAVLFVLLVVVILLGSAPLTGTEWLADIRDWIVNVPGMAGMRGLLLGVALGTVITALRVLMTSERPHSEF